MCVLHIIAFALVVAIIPCAADGFYAPFGCQGVLTEQARYEILDQHDAARNSINAGLTKDMNGKVLPAAENMYRLLWSCELEELARKSLKDCTVPLPTAMYGLNYDENPSNFESFNTTFLWIVDIQKQAWPIDNTLDSDKLRKYANVIQAKTTAVGCSQKTCGIRNRMACYYNQPDVAIGQKIYETGTPCTKNSQCTTYKGSVCDKPVKLCVAPQDNNEICPMNTDMNDKLRNRALEMHNYRRSKLAKGEVERHTGNKYPEAANMVKLRYSCDLEISAKVHADKCDKTESDPNQRIGVGENVFWIKESDSVPFRVNATEQAIMHWWSQVGSSSVGPGVDKVTFRKEHLSSPIRWFTMMAWADTYRVGCGVTKCKGFFDVVCHYKKGGNIPDQVLYEKGTQCANCPNGFQCEQGKGLCAKI